MYQRSPFSATQIIPTHEPEANHWKICQNFQFRLVSIPFGNAALIFPWAKLAEQAFEGICLPVANHLTFRKYPILFLAFSHIDAPRGRD